MTKISELKKVTDPVQAAESEHEGSKIALRISPLATFLLEAGLHNRIGGSKTRAATILFEAAIQDWAISQGIELEGDDFRNKYLRWLTRRPITLEDIGETYFNSDHEVLDAIARGEEVYESVTL